MVFLNSAYSVVLVHGFEDTTNASSCEIELKQWYRTADERLKGSSQPIRVVSFKFDMEAILKGAEDINAYSNQLGTFLLDLEPGKVEERPGLSEGHSKVMEDGRRSAQPQNMPSFVLVGHGIGCWVVREFCSERSYQTVAINTTGIIFLNDPATLGLENENEYVNFLGNFVRLCEFDPKDISLKDFGRLFKIDTAFRQVLQTSTSKIPRPSTTSNLSVWIPYSIEGLKDKANLTNTLILGHELL
ncbi:hypothetical protein QQS21_003381 [Conoideocrella luteorostrata]|uniref:Uncharacterized protein n=1 Tax=Conoideocrella luteorostrata TaxID=1105319 RepID=A0AAJ0CTG0_9HYPO|nr:hypothetical protein QQS21_003381 [Conoideocrella luteorostrata]